MMNLGISDDLHLFSEELERHLSPLALTQLAKETGFITRNSRGRLSLRNVDRRGRRHFHVFFPL